MGITHEKVSGLPNPADPSLVGGEDWDADHVIALQDADIPATIARDADVQADIAAEATLARNADNLTSGTVADARIAGTIARDSEVTAAISALSTVYQPLDSDLTAIAALSTTAYGRALLALADAAALRTAAGLGTAATANAGDFDAAGAAAAAQAAAIAASQPLDSDLTAFAALAIAADKLPYGTGSHTLGLADFTAAGRALVDDADAVTQRTTLGLGTAATANTGDFDAAGAAAAAQAASQPLDSDLTAIAALAPANDDIVQRKAGAWTNRTIAQLLTDLAAPGTTFQPLDSDLTAIAALTTTAYGRSVLEAANASALRTLAGLVIGTDVRAQGSGDPTRASLGLATSDSPEFAALNVGAATDTTITRTGAGDIAVEGNALYRAGGTDVPVADGGTGSSTAAGAATNLGLGTGDTPQFNGVNVGHASDTTLTRASAGDLAVEGNAIYRAGGTDVPVADGGTGASNASGARTNLGLVISTDVAPAARVYAALGADVGPLTANTWTDVLSLVLPAGNFDIWGRAEALLLTVMNAWYGLRFVDGSGALICAQSQYIDNVAGVSTAMSLFGTCAGGQTIKLQAKTDASAKMTILRRDLFDVAGVATNALARSY